MVVVELAREQVAEERRMVDQVRVIVGQDFGVLRTVSILLRCFRNPQTGRPTWWACDELTSTEGVSAGYHASQLSRMVEPSTCLVVADPQGAHRSAMRADEVADGSVQQVAGDQMQDLAGGGLDTPLVGFGQRLA